MNLSTADLRNYWTEFHETLWSYRYMFLVGERKKERRKKERKKEKERERGGE
jgi:hypothetical protein